MSEMIDRVALAICGDDNTANILAIHRTRARAAIEAMRSQPITQSVIERIIRNNRVMRGGESLMAELWSAMIDAALSEKP